MLATAGTERSAMRVKSGSEPLVAAVPVGVETARPDAVFWAPSPLPLSARPVMTRPARKPSPASSSAIRVNRRTSASGSDGDSTGRRRLKFGNPDCEHALFEIGGDRGVIDRERQLER